MRHKSVLFSLSLSLMMSMGIWSSAAVADLEQTLKHIPEKPMGLVSVETDFKAWETLLKNKPFSDLADLIKEMQGGMEAELQKDLGLNLQEDLLKMIGTHMVTALYEVPPTADFPDVLVSLDLRDKNKFNHLIETLKKVADKEGEKIVEFQYKSYKGFTLAPSKKASPDQPDQSNESTLFVVATDKTMLVSNRRKFLEKGLDAINGQGSVINEKKFKPVYEALKKEKIFFYGDVGVLIDKGLNQIGAAKEKQIAQDNPLHGIDEIFGDFGQAVQGAFALYDSFGFGLNVDLNGLKISNSFVFKDKKLTESQKKYVAKLTAKPAKPLEPILNSIPAQPLMAFVSQGMDLNLEETSMAVFDPQNAKTQKEKEDYLKIIKEIKEGVEKFVGVDLQKDVLDYSDGRFGMTAFYLEKYPSYKNFPHVVAYLGIKDEAKFEKTIFEKFHISNATIAEIKSLDMEKMLDMESDQPTPKTKPLSDTPIMFSFDIETLEVYEGYNIHRLIGPGIAELEKELGIRPTFAHQNGLWYFASSPTALKAALDIANHRQPSLLQHPEFQRVRNQMAGANGNSIGYFDLSRWYDMGNYLLRNDNDFKRVKPLLKAFRILAIDGSVQKDSTSGHLIVDVDMPKLDFSKLGDGNATATAQVSSVKANMHTVQTLAETYAVDWGGTYPKDLTLMQKEAIKGHYWKELTNPFTHKMGLAHKTNHLQGSIMDYNTYKNFKPHPKFAGMALYEAVIIKHYSTRDFTSYRIYGCDEKGELIKGKDGKVFYLTNS